MTSNDGGDTPEPENMPPEGGDGAPGEETPETGDIEETRETRGTDETLETNGTEEIPETSGTDETLETSGIEDDGGPLVGDETEPENKRGRMWVPAAIVGVVVVLGLAAWLFIPRAAPPLALAERLPADAQIYAELDLEALGSDETKEFVDQVIPLIEGVTGEPVDSNELGEMFAAELEKGLGDVGLNFEEDISPWLSSRIAFGVSGIDPESFSAESMAEMEEAPEEMVSEVPNVVVIAAGKESAELDEFLTKLDGALEESGAPAIETISIEGNDIRTFSDEEASAAYGRVGSDFVFSVAGPDEDPTALLTDPDAPTLGEDETFQSLMGEVPDGALIRWGVSGDLAASFTEMSVPWSGGYFDLVDGDLEIGSMSQIEDAESNPLSDLWGDEPVAASHIPADNSLFYLRFGAIGDLILQAVDMMGEQTPEMEQEISDFEAQSGFTLEEIMALFNTDSALALGWQGGSPTPLAALVAVGDGDPQAIIERLGAQFGSLDESIQQEENGYSMAGMGGLYWRDNATLAVFGQDVPTEMPEESLLDSEAYARASELVAGEVVFFLDIDAAVDLAAGQGAAIGMEVPPAITECNPFHFAASGVETDGDLVRSVTRLDVEAPEGCESGATDTGDTSETDDTAESTTETTAAG
ncbi:MAG: hypothetical protein GEU79_10370 [Acidimicrobiia bacterium]|nr:hypothetical protein [Acidimicrobiia bacterium]